MTLVNIPTKDKTMTKTKTNKPGHSRVMLWDDFIEGRWTPTYNLRPCPEGSYTAARAFPGWRDGSCLPTWAAMGITDLVTGVTHVMANEEAYMRELHNAAARFSEVKIEFGAFQFPCETRCGMTITIEGISLRDVTCIRIGCLPDV